jgi:hypothetical protein
MRRLIDLLAQPVHAAHNRPRDFVWHCSIRNAPEDRLLTDGPGSTSSWDGSGLRTPGPAVRRRGPGVRGLKQSRGPARFFGRAPNQSQPPGLPARSGEISRRQRVADLCRRPAPGASRCPAGAARPTVPARIWPRPSSRCSSTRSWSRSATSSDTDP